MKRTSVYAGIGVAMVILMVALVGLRYEKRPAIRMVVTGFVTNRYVFFSGDYVCAIVAITNGGGERYNSRNIFAGATPSGPIGAWGGPGPEWEVRSGRGVLEPHSGRTAEVSIYRDSMETITVSVSKWPAPAGSLPGVPAGLRNWLQRFFQRKPKFQNYEATTAPFSVTNPVPFELELRWEAIKPQPKSSGSSKRDFPGPAKP